jgi:2-succinyl-5-enolpyruvyl-6-hydroxy-3-cyclohexene-1-carboxylate synthase
LYEITEEINVNPISQSIEKNKNTTDPNLLRKLISDWNSASKKMILVGVSLPNAVESQLLECFAQDDSVIVFTETTSNIHHPEFFPSIDKIIAPLTEEEFLALKPDILLTFGGMIVSKKVKAFLRRYKPDQHWHIDKKKAYDTFFRLNEHIKEDVNYFLTLFAPKLKPNHSQYKPSWKLVKELRSRKHKDYLQQIGFSDLLAFDSVLTSLPKHCSLQVGNSSAIRYTQLFDLDPSINVFCNRGTSGIDGSTSTAIGCATVSNEQVVFISGDLSFFYDSNALWNNYIPQNFRIILINNEGGGIFRILPGEKNTENFDTYFETKHKMTAEHLCKMHNINYTNVNNNEDLKKVLTDFYNDSNSPKLLEIFTPRTENDIILLNYFNFIK